MNTKTLISLAAALVLLWGCSSQDFGPPLLSVTDFVDSGKPYLTDSEEAKQRAARLADMLIAWEKDRPQREQDYSIGADDVLEIAVLSLDTPGELTTLKRAVRQDGMITLPLAGDVTAAGLTPHQMETAIINTYRGKYLQDPSVTLKVAEYRSAPIVLTGAVNKPGVYYLTHNNSTILEVLGLADGLSASAGDTLTIVRSRKRESSGRPSAGRADASMPGVATNAISAAPVQPPAVPEEPTRSEAGGGEKPVEAVLSRDDSRAGSEMILVDLHQLLIEGDLRLNVIVQGGDVITVPVDQKKYVYVMGYVRNPGAFEIRTGGQLDVLQAVAMAGGLSSTARAENSFLISMRTGARKRTPVDLTKIARGVRPTVQLYPGDTLVVGSGLLARLSEFIKPTIGASASITPVP
jgi:polysaccharide export outer membrane protein